jgi:hypothetical protein
VNRLEGPTVTTMGQHRLFQEQKCYPHPKTDYGQPKTSAEYIQATSRVERIVLVHRLREVVAQVGFTRFEAASPDIEGELEMGVRRATLAREVSWLPAVENKGEGIFMQFRRQEVEAWFNRPEVQKRGQQLLAGFECWKTEHQGTHREFPGLPYLMLHSFSHSLITAVSLECGYAVYQGQRVFQALADRMEEIPALNVRMFLDVQRGPGDTSASREIVRRFADRFRVKQWPKDKRQPEVYFDPRALELNARKKTCLHAKCIVVDRRDLFVSSANFTEAAHERNLEVGLLIHSPVLAERVQNHFETLVDAKLLAQLQ